MPPKRPPGNARGGRNVKSQQLAQQKKDMRGFKARRDLQADEERRRAEMSEESFRLLDQFQAQEAEEVVAVKDRLIQRLGDNIAQLHAETRTEVDRTRTERRDFCAGVLHFLSALKAADFVDTEPLELLERGEPADQVASAIGALGERISERLKDNDAVTVEARRQRSIMAKELADTRRQLQASERIVVSRYLPSATSESRTAAEILRERGAVFEQRMAAVEAERREAFERVVREAAWRKFQLVEGMTHDGRQLTSLDETPADAMKARFLSDSERCLQQQGDILRDLQASLAELATEHVATTTGRLREQRTNLPFDVATAVNEDCTIEELRRLVHYASFEPRVAEEVSALVRGRAAAEEAVDVSPPRAPHDMLTEGALVVAGKQALAVLPPREAKVAYPRATLIHAPDRVAPGFADYRLQPTSRNRPTERR